MKLKSLLIFTATLFSMESAMACNWYRTGAFGETLECRTSYKDNWLNNTERVNRTIEAAKAYAMGEIQSISNESWAVRNSISVKEGATLIDKRINATKIINEMNTQINRRAAMDEGLSKDDFVDIMPAAMMVGYTLPVNPNLRLSDRVAASVGASVFVGAMILPQKVIYRMDNTGKLTEANELTFDIRTIISPSGDLAVTKNSKFKNTGMQFTLGFVFAENVYGSHQLLGSGWSISVPTQVAKTSAVATAAPLQATSWFAKSIEWMIVKTGQTMAFMTSKVPNWLLLTASPYFDTVKIGLITSHQDPNMKVSDKEVKSFAPAVYVWLRRPARKNAVDMMTVEGTPQDAAADIVQGKVRGSKLWVNGVFNDGISKQSDTNGMNGEGSIVLLNTLKSIYENYIPNTSDNGEVRVPSIEEKIEARLNALRGDVDRRVLEKNEIAALKKTIETYLKDPTIDTTEKSFYGNQLKEVLKDLK